MAGLWFEQFSVGQTFEHEIRRSVTERWKRLSRLAWRLSWLA